VLLVSTKLSTRASVPLRAIFPFTGETISRFASAGRQDARSAVDAASAAFAAWSCTPPGRRRKLFLKAADILDRCQPEIAKIMAEETGGTFGWGIFNCIFTAGLLREAASQAYGLIGEVIPSDLSDTVATATRQPVGVVAGIAPWNAPLILGMRAVAAPLAFGNTVVFKASEESPGTHLAIAEIFSEAGFPNGVINVITNSPAKAAEVVDELICHSRTRRINFTGSTRVGRIIAEKAGRQLKRVLLELGGKAPMIVFEDADISAVAAANFGAFVNQGQICRSTERIVIESGVADVFLRASSPRKPRRLRLGTHFCPKRRSVRWRRS
jgi:vanillin dehydrogenase